MSESTRTALLFSLTAWVAAIIGVLTQQPTLAAWFCTLLLTVAIVWMLRDG